MQSTPVDIEPMDFSDGGDMFKWNCE